MRRTAWLAALLCSMPSHAGQLAPSPDSSREATLKSLRSLALQQGYPLVPYEIDDFLDQARRNGDDPADILLRRVRKRLEYGKGAIVLPAREDGAFWKKLVESGHPYCSFQKDNEVVHVDRYRSVDGKYRLSVYSVSGHEMFMAWASDEDRDPVTRNAPDHVIALKKDSVWYSALAQSPKRAHQEKDGELVGLTYTLVDSADGETVVEVEVKVP